MVSNNEWYHYQLSNNEYLDPKRIFPKDLNSMNEYHSSIHQLINIKFYDSFFKHVMTND